MVLPWKRFWRRSLPYPVISFPAVCTTNWSVETKYPISYLSRSRMPYFSGTCLTLTTPGDRFLALPNMQDSHAGTAQVSAVSSLGEMNGSITDLVPSGSTTFCGFIIYWIRCILITLFQCHNNSSFWALKNYDFHLHQHRDHRTECNVHTRSWSCYQSHASHWPFMLKFVVLQIIQYWKS